jgi:hypothetical protein
MASAPGPMMGTMGASSSLVRQLGISLGPALATLAWALSGYHPSGMRVGYGIATMAALMGGLFAARARPRESSPP